MEVAKSQMFMQLSNNISIEYLISQLIEMVSKLENDRCASLGNEKEKMINGILPIERK